MALHFPKSDQCRRILDELEGDPALTEWEYNFIESNKCRTEFTDAQREAIGRMMEKYEVD